MLIAIKQYITFLWKYTLNAYGYNYYRKLGHRKNSKDIRNHNACEVCSVLIWVLTDWMEGFK